MKPKSDEEYEETPQPCQGGVWSNGETPEPDFLTTAELIMSTPAIGPDFMGLVSAHQNITALRNLSAIHKAFDKHDQQLPKR